MLDWLQYVAWYEVLWTLSAFTCVLSSGYGSLVSLGDYFYAEEEPDSDPIIQKELLEIGRDYVLYETSIFLCALFFMYLGIRALLLPSNPGSTNFWSVFTGLSLFSLNVYLTITSIRIRFSRNRLDKELVSSSVSLAIVRRRLLRKLHIKQKVSERGKR